MMEKDLIGMSRERENLRAQVENAERRARGMVFCLFDLHLYYSIVQLLTSL